MPTTRCDHLVTTLDDSRVAHQQCAEVPRHCLVLFDSRAYPGATFIIADVIADESTNRCPPQALVISNQDLLTAELLTSNEQRFFNHCPVLSDNRVLCWSIRMYAFCVT